MAIVFSVLRRYTDSDYSFGIFKLFLLLVNFTTFLIGCTFYSNSVILQMPKSNQIPQNKY